MKTACWKTWEILGKYKEYKNFLASICEGISLKSMCNASFQLTRSLDKIPSISYLFFRLQYVSWHVHILWFKLPSVNWHFVQSSISQLTCSLGFHLSTDGYVSFDLPELNLVHSPKNKADFRKYRGGSPLEGKFPDNSRKLGIISSDYWEISEEMMPSFRELSGNFPSRGLPPQYFRKSALFSGRCISFYSIFKNIYCLCKHKTRQLHTKPFSEMNIVKRHTEVNHLFHSMSKLNQIVPHTWGFEQRTQVQSIINQLNMELIFLSICQAVEKKSVTCYFSKRRPQKSYNIDWEWQDSTRNTYSSWRQSRVALLARSC